MRKILQIFIILLITVTVSIAKHEGSFNVEEIDKSGDFFDLETLTVEYSIGFLMGEMVLSAKAKYSLGKYITIDGVAYKISNFPDEVINKLKLTELKVKVGVMSGLALPNMYVSIDLGAMSKPDKWSYNTPGSPNWDKFIYNGPSDSPMYFDKEKTIKVMKEFKRFGLGEHLSGASTMAVKYDVSAVRDYLNKQKQDKLKREKEKEKAIAEAKKENLKKINERKALFRELERREKIEYKRRIDKENTIYLDKLFANLEQREKANYYQRIKKKTKKKVKSRTTKRKITYSNKHTSYNNKSRNTKQKSNLSEKERNKRISYKCKKKSRRFNAGEGQVTPHCQHAIYNQCVADNLCPYYPDKCSRMRKRVSTSCSILSRLGYRSCPVCN